MAEWDVSYRKTTRKESSRSEGGSSPPVQIGCGLFLLAAGVIALVAAVV